MVSAACVGFRCCSLRAVNTTIGTLGFQSLDIIVKIQTAGRPPFLAGYLLRYSFLDRRPAEAIFRANKGAVASFLFRRIDSYEFGPFRLKV